MKYVHCVYFTMKEQTPQSNIDAQIADARNLLARIPGVREVISGQRDTSVNREVSLTDFDIGLTVLLDDRAALDAYSNHELHVQYVAEHKHKWQHIRVCDFMAK